MSEQTVTAGAVAPARQRIPGLIRRNTVLFALAQALQGSGTQMLVALGALIVLELTGSALLTGIGVSAMQLSRIFISYPLGKLADTFGRRPAMLAGLACGMMGAPFLAASVLLESFPVFLFGAFVFGMGVGATQQLRVAVADMYPPTRRGEALGYLLTGSLVGTLIAPALIAASERLTGVTGVPELAMPWLLVPGTVLPTVFIVLAVRPDPKTIATNLADYWPGHPAAPARRGRGRMSFWEYLRAYPRLTASACYAPAQGVMSMLMATTPLVLKHHGHSLTSVSIAVTLHVLGMYAFSIPLGRVADRVGRVRLLWGGLCTSVVGALLVPAFPLYAPITLGIFLVGVGWSAVFVAATAVIADTSTPQVRGRAVGVNDSLASAFAISLPLLGGLLAESIGFMAVGVFGAALAIAPMTTLLRLREDAPGVYRGYADEEEAA